MFAPTIDIGIMMGVFVYSMGFWVCIGLSRTYTGKISFVLLLVLTLWLFYSIYFRVYVDIIFLGYDIGANSDEVFRYCSLMAIGASSDLTGEESIDNRMRDGQITIISLVLLMLSA